MQSFLLVCRNTQSLRQESNLRPRNCWARALFTGVIEAQSPVEISALGQTEKCENAENLSPADPRKSGSRCCLQHCRKSRRTFPYMKLFTFPHIDSPLFKQWAGKCNLDEQLIKNSSKLFLCERHFPVDCIGKRYLKRGAVPSLHLCETDEIVQNMESESYFENIVCLPKSPAE
ncbi:hypothetical protein EVAR_72195_1 [Eumeta japonica]|uniref:THAP-type domain-containing protein n=1 Tax=Eumeta variegata TaxID=151549 RepID=A0A4C1SF53_EUMVA|nr:hypothetical protein EVAR_72195_1 [Eumeta japonica]